MERSQRCRGAQQSSWPEKKELCLAAMLLTLCCVGGVTAAHQTIGAEGTAGSSVIQAPSNTGIHDKIQLTPQVVVALVLACSCALMANAAGVGGGPIYLPLLMVLLGFELTPATALSHTIVATSAVASSIYGLIATSPNDPSRTLIDWDLTIFIPALLIGVSVGVLFNVLLPRWLQTVLLTILLLSVVYKTLTRGLKMWRSERKDTALKARLQAQQEAEENGGRHDDSDSDTEGVMHDEAYHLKPHRVTRSMSLQWGSIDAALRGNSAAGDNRTPLLPASRQDQDSLHSSHSPNRRTAAKRAIRGCLGRQPIFKIGAVVLLWAIFLVFQELKTHHNRCSAPYLGLFAGEVALLIIFTVAGIAFITWKARQDPDNVDPELRGVLLQDPSNTSSSHNPIWRITIVAAVMAFAARALIFNPFLLALGVHPQVTASTSVLMILFSSSAIAISLGFQGYLNVSYAVVFAPIAFVASILGVTLIGRLVKKTGHTSIIVFILTFLIAVGTILTAVIGGIQSYNEYKAGGPVGLKPFCGQ